MRPIVLMLLALSFPSVTQAFDVTACGQVVPPATVGRLVADLSCDPGVGIGPAAVLLSGGSTLDLAGHRLDPGGNNVGVQNVEPKGASVRVVGPGVIAGAAFGVWTVGTTRLELADVTIADNAVGVIGGPITLVNVRLTGNTVYALQGTRIVADGLVVSDNPGQGIGANRIDGRNVTVTNNGSWGIYVLQHAVFEALTARGNGLVGLRCDRCRPRLKASTLTGNDLDEVGIDLQSRGKPRLIRSVCTKSSGIGSGPWGVCLED